MPSKCFASWASPNWTRPPRRRDKNRSCSDQPQNPPPYLLGVTGHNVKHALVNQPHWNGRHPAARYGRAPARVVAAAHSVNNSDGEIAVPGSARYDALHKANDGNGDL